METDDEELERRGWKRMTKSWKKMLETDDEELEEEVLLETDDEELEEDEPWKRMTKSWKKMRRKSNLHGPCNHLFRMCLY